jgi:hypothetical protein
MTHHRVRLPTGTHPHLFPFLFVSFFSHNSARRRNGIFATHVFGLAESMLLSLQHRSKGGAPVMVSHEFARLATSISEMRKIPGGHRAGVMTDMLNEEQKRIDDDKAAAKAAAKVGRLLIDWSFEYCIVAFLPVPNMKLFESRRVCASVLTSFLRVFSFSRHFQSAAREAKEQAERLKQQQQLEKAQAASPRPTPASTPPPVEQSQDESATTTSTTSNTTGAAAAAAAAAATTTAAAVGGGDESPPGEHVNTESPVSVCSDKIAPKDGGYQRRSSAL